MDMIAIRKAKASERPTIQAMARAVIGERYSPFMGRDMVDGYVESGQADAEFVTHRDSLYVLLEGPDIAGFCICFRDFVHLMMIRLDRQGLGLGSVLLNWCEEMIRSRGHAAARLETFLANQQAIGFYRKNGWQEVKRDDDDAGALARIWFEKALGAS